MTNRNSHYRHSSSGVLCLAAALSRQICLAKNYFSHLKNSQKHNVAHHYVHGGQDGQMGQKKGTHCRVNNCVVVDSDVVEYCKVGSGQERSRTDYISIDSTTRDCQRCVGTSLHIVVLRSLNRLYQMFRSLYCACNTGHTSASSDHVRKIADNMTISVQYEQRCGCHEKWGTRGIIDLLTELALSSGSIETNLNKNISGCSTLEPEMCEKH